jgi:hypothetical protein
MPEQGEHLVPAHQGATGELTDDEWMERYLLRIEKLDEVGVRATEVVDPDRRVDEGGHSG